MSGHRVEVWDGNLAWRWCVVDSRTEGRQPAIASGVAPDEGTARACGDAVARELKIGCQQQRLGEG